MLARSLIINDQGEFHHHAYLISGDREAILRKLLAFFEDDLKMQVRGNPDLLQLSFEVFGVDEGRALKELQAKKAISGERRFFVVCVNTFTHEAQNSLLKVFEDPSPGTHFFVVVPSADGMIPTLQSRFLLIQHKEVSSSGDTGSLPSPAEFLRASSKERLDSLKSVIENKDKEAAFAFIDKIEKELHQTFGSTRSIYMQDTVRDLRNIALLRGYLHDRSPSIKLILEHLALTLPRER